MNARIRKIKNYGRRVRAIGDRPRRPRGAPIAWLRYLATAWVARRDARRAVTP